MIPARFLVAIILPIVFLAPDIAVQWQDDKGTVRVKLGEYDMHTFQCMQSGLEVRHRLELRSCVRRGSWFDHCSDSEQIMRTVTYEPVSENYSIVTDLISDKEPPATVVVTDIDQAQQSMREFFIPATLLRPPTSNNRDALRYMSLRIRGYCQRDEKSLFTQIPYYLTFGIFRFAGFDTGWVDYEIAR